MCCKACLLLTPLAIALGLTGTFGFFAYILIIVIKSSDLEIGYFIVQLVLFAFSGVVALSSFCLLMLMSGYKEKDSEDSKNPKWVSIVWSNLEHLTDRMWSIREYFDLVGEENQTITNDLESQAFEEDFKNSGKCPEHQTHAVDRIELLTNC